MPNRTNVPVPSANAARSTLQVVSWTSSTDQYALVLDLNDGTGTSWSIVPGSFKLGTPEKKYVESDNIRAPGSSVVKQQYGNMKVSATFTLRGASVADIIAKVRALVQAVDNPKQTPYALRIALPQATQYSYAWVLKCKHDVPLGDTRKVIQQALTGITIVWDCAPGYLGDRLTLQNLANNPGFESPMGGGNAQIGALAFSDTLANFNAYVVQAGGALSQDTMRYTDVVQSDGPRRYLRFGEASGTVANEVIGANNGTIAGGVTLGVAGAIVGSSDTAYTFNGSTGKVTVPTALLPTGNNAFSMECWFKFAANPASAQIFLGYGDPAHGNRAFLEFQLQTTGAVVFNCGTNAVSSAVLTTGVYHHLLGTYDGTTMTFYVDGASVGTPQTPAGGLIIPASPTLIAGCSLSSAAFFSGQLDEWAVYNTALSAARASAHFTVGHNAPTATGNTMVIPAAGRVSFGSANWGALQNWQVRFRYLAGGTYSFYLHYTDANNNLQAQVTSTQIKLIHTIGGVANTLATSAAFSVALQTEVQYWVQVTQLPNPTGSQPTVQATLFVDSGGAMSSNYASISASTQSPLTATSGAPQMAAAGAALGIGGAFTNVHAVFLFGPGGWQVVNAGTGTASGVWEQNTANTYPTGPVTSNGAARLDLAPAGTVDAKWRLYAGGFTTGQQNPIPVRAAGNVLRVSAWAKSSGLGGSAAVKLTVSEYDVNGAFLRTDTGWSGGITPSLSAAGTASYAQLTSDYTTGTSCVYLDVGCRVVDATTGSVGASVWFDNVSVWNKSTTSQDGMDYHELRFPNSPIMGVVSGLQGDLPAPALVAMGTITNVSIAGTPAWTFMLARRSAPASTPVLTGPAQFAGLATLDATAFGGWYSSPSSAPGSGVAVQYQGWNTGTPTNPLAPMTGQYHLFLRAKYTGATGNVANVSLSTKLAEGLLNLTALGASAVTPAVTPFAVGSLWTLCDAGIVNLPISPAGAARDLTTCVANLTITWTDTTGSASATQQNWYCFLPVDASVLIAKVNLVGSGIPFAGQMLWVYADGLAAARGAVGWTFNYGDNHIFDVSPATGVGGAGTTSSDNVNVNPVADPFLTLDPSLDTGSAAAQIGVNQLIGFAIDSAGAQGAMQLLAEIQYTPTYLYPR